MQLEVRIHAAEVGDSLRAYIDRRLRFALGRFGERVGRVRVGISDLNGPRGGVDKCCRVSAALVPFGRVVVEEVDGDVYAAIDRAAGRLGRSFTRRLKRAPIPGKS
jgi:ribosomal subunit interface protein